MSARIPSPSLVAWSLLCSVCLSIGGGCADDDSNARAERGGAPSRGGQSSSGGSETRGGSSGTRAQGGSSGTRAQGGDAAVSGDSSGGFINEGGAAGHAGVGAQPEGGAGATDTGAGAANEGGTSAEIGGAGAGAGGGEASSPWLAYQLIGDTEQPLFLTELSPSAERVELLDSQSRGFMWRSDGAALAYWTARTLVVVQGFDDGDVARRERGPKLADDVELVQASYSPDGRWLAVQVADGHSSRWFVTRSSEDGPWREIGEGVTSDAALAPADFRVPLAWSPDSRHLAFREDDRITSVTFAEPGPTWSLLATEASCALAIHLEWSPGSSSLLLIDARDALCWLGPHGNESLAVRASELTESDIHDIAFAPDESALLYVANDVTSGAARYRAFIRPLGAGGLGEPVRVPSAIPADHLGVSAAHWLPDASGVLLRGDLDGVDAKLFVAGADGALVTKLGADLPPTARGEGERMQAMAALLAASAGDARSALYELASADWLTPKHLVDLPPGERFASFAGTLEHPPLVLAVHAESGASRLYSLDRSSSAPTLRDLSGPISADGYVSPLFCRLAPDGAWAAFAADVDGSGREAVFVASSAAGSPSPRALPRANSGWVSGLAFRPLRP